MLSKAGKTDDAFHMLMNPKLGWMHQVNQGATTVWENYFVIEPHTVSQLDSIRLSYDSAYGTVESGWEKTEDGYVFRIVIPSNCKAEVRLPGKEMQMFGPGTYEL